MNPPDEQRTTPVPGDEPGPEARPAAVEQPLEKERDIFGRVPKDRADWSHRRGEPRVFALLWMLYLMGVTGVMFMSVSDAFFVSTSITRPAARGMMLATIVGIVLLWPAMRLSQRPAPRAVRSVLQDLFVLLVPAQAVVWPHALRVLGDWPVQVLLGLVGVMTAWALVVGGLIALANAGRHAGRARGVWMLVVLGAVFLGPLAGGLTGPGAAVAGSSGEPARPAWMLSPLTAVLEITRNRDASGTPNPVGGIHWRLIIATGCVGGALLCVAGSAGVASGRGRA